MGLSPEAAAYVDAQVAPFAHKIGLAQLDRVVEEAIARFMPDLAEANAEKAADGRHLSFHHQQVSFTGTTTMTVQASVAALNAAESGERSRPQCGRRLACETLPMADEGMSEDEAQALAVVVRQAAEHVVEVQPDDHNFVVVVRRAVPGDSFMLYDEQDWQWLEQRIREPQWHLHLVTARSAADPRAPAPSMRQSRASVAALNAAESTREASNATWGISGRRHT